MSYEQLKVENSSFFIAHGSKPVAHSKKENYEKDFTTYNCIIIFDYDFCAVDR